MIDKLINLKLPDIINISHYLEILNVLYAHRKSDIHCTFQGSVKSLILCCAVGNWKKLYKHFKMGGFVTAM